MGSVTKPAPAAVSDELDASVLFTPLKIGPYQLQHRIVLAPLTRCRSTNTVPQPAAAGYYAQRTTEGGLLIAEATVIDPKGHGYPDCPGLYTQEQVDAWKPIVKAVHDKGGVFFSQIWHVGRASHSFYQPNGGVPVAPSAVAITSGQVWLGGTTMADYPVPEALTKKGIAATVEAFRIGARNAIAAGFDGVEIHGAHGYLIDEFLKETSNLRDDEYGGSLENRCRFLLEVVDAVIAEVGAERTGIRLSPYSTFFDTSTEDPIGLAVYLARQLSSRGLAYLHVVEPRMNGQTLVDTKHSLGPIRDAYKGVLLSAGGFERSTAITAVAENAADAIVFGRKFLANPDLPRRLRLNAPLNAHNRDTFYTSDQVVGYTDYPFLPDDYVRG